MGILNLPLERLLNGIYMYVITHGLRKEIFKIPENISF